MLGLHRKIPVDSPLSAPEREHRIRVWWTVYSLDRIMSSKIGLPTMIQDTDIDVQLPSKDGLSHPEMEDFYDPAYLVAQITLSRITGNVLGNIYHIPQHDRANTFVRGVQTILTSLRNFHEALPPLLRLDHHSSPMYLNRSVASLHLHFNQVSQTLNYYVLLLNLIVCHSYHATNFILLVPAKVPRKFIRAPTTAISHDDRAR